MLMRPVIFSIVLLIVAAVIIYIAQQEWSGLEESHEVAKPAESEKTAKKSQRGTKDNPIVVEILPAPKSKAQARYEGYEQYEKPKNEKYLVWATIALSVFTLALACFTAFLWSSTSDLVERSEKTAQTIERAYVQMSHASGPNNPGLKVDPISGECSVQIGIKNYGSTPARVTRIFLTKRILGTLLPDLPDYRPDPGETPEQPTEAFLMKDTEIGVGWKFTIDISDIPLIASQEKQLAIYGFVDYTDQFGRDFRGGYARNWVPNLPSNNLVFVQQPRYNYDCPRKGDQCQEWA